MIKIGFNLLNKLKIFKKLERKKKEKTNKKIIKQTKFIPSDLFDDPVFFISFIIYNPLIDPWLNPEIYINTPQISQNN
jgi:hypothetical protein